MPMARRKNEPELFAEERKALQTARKEIQSDKHASNGLREGYEQLLTRYEKFIRETGKILNISDSQSLALKRMDTELKSLLNNAGQGFLTIDRSLKIQKQFSSECKRMLGRKIAGLSFPELIWPNDATTQANVQSTLIAMLDEDKQPVSSFSPELPDTFEKNGLLVRIEYKKIVHSEGIDEPRIMIILTDMTEQYQSRERLEFLSTHDSLTGLFNRNYIDRWVVKQSAEASEPLSLIMTDMNGLKLVNDVFGHLQGDQLLVRSAELLRNCFDDEEAICARWGGDEFLVLMPGADARACSDKVQQIVAACERTESNPIKISMAIGTVTRSSGNRDYSQLFLEAEKEMYKKKLIESRNVRKKLIEDISETMYESGYEDRSHVDRVTEMAVSLAEQLGIVRNSPSMNMLVLLARLHDVGKIAIPREIFRHGEGMTSHQWDVMRTHSEVGYRLAFSLGEPALAEAILSMHERWDGRGYPYGLQREQIPELSRLLAIVDAFDIMTNDQTYRKSLSQEEAIMEIMVNSGTQFDPLVVEMFVRWLKQNQE
jgi:diguanylate cyclase (GGDEF)-like protein